MSGTKTTGTVFLFIGFVLVTTASWMNAQASAEGGADFGAGGLLLLGNAFGGFGVICVLIAVIGFFVQRRRQR